jgi:hypothetical protein
MKPRTNQGNKTQRSMNRRENFQDLTRLCITLMTAMNLAETVYLVLLQIQSTIRNKTLLKELMISGESD